MSKTIKWLVAFAVVGGVLWFLQSLNGDRPQTRIEEPVQIDALK